MSLEGDAAIEFYVSRIGDATGLWVYEGTGGDEAEKIVVEEARSNSGPRAHSRSSRGWMDFRFVAKAIVEGNDARANELAREIDDAVENSVNVAIPALDGMVMHCMNEGDVRYEERDGDRRFYHRGATYWTRVTRNT
jgi:hypothetical protein